MVMALTVKDMRKILVRVLFLRSAVAIVKRVMRFLIAPSPGFFRTSYGPEYSMRTRCTVQFFCPLDYRYA